MRAMLIGGYWDSDLLREHPLTDALVSCHASLRLVASTFGTTRSRLYRSSSVRREEVEPSQVLVTVIQEDTEGNPSGTQTHAARLYS